MELLDLFRGNEKAECLKAKEKQQREEIQLYLDQEGNQGTRTQSMMFSFFTSHSPNSEKEDNLNNQRYVRLR